MSAQRLGIGFVGSGFITRFHLQSFVSVRDADVLGIWSPNPANAAATAAYARELDIGAAQAFATIEEMVAAMEDVGLADPNALVQCLAAKDAYDFLGSPEGEIALVQACLYLATAPKSNATYKAQKAAWRTAKETGSLMPPKTILNAPTKLMKEIGYGAGYEYDHDSEGGFSGADYWPEEMTPQTFYTPTDRGFEKRVAERIAYWESLRREKQR
jgi:putative ATPase